MREPYGEGLTSHPGPESYAGDGNVMGVALARGTRRPAIELRNHSFTCRPCDGRGKARWAVALLVSGFPDVAES